MHVPPRRRMLRQVVVAVALLSLAGAPVVSPAQPHDPLRFSTYLGDGHLEETLRDVAIGRDGDIFAVGGSYSAPSPCGTLAGNMDVLLLRFGADGRRVWCQLLGGPGYDRAYDVAVAADGDLIVGGRAGVGFPVTNRAFDQSFDGSPDVPPYGPQDGFVCKLRALDGNVVWCTYFGGPDKRIVRGVDVDADGDVYVASGACDDLENDPAYPMRNARNPGGPGCDAVAAKLRGDGAALLWGRYVGGSNDDGGCGTVAVDPANEEVYHLTCWTRSSDMPVRDAFDAALGGTIDAHLAVISPDGGSLRYASYVGGSRVDSNGLHGLAYAGNGVVYVETDSDSDDIPATAGAHQPADPGNPTVGDWGGNCVVWRVDTTRTGPASLLRATYLGGGSDDLCEGIQLAPSGEVVLPVSSTSGDLELAGGLACSTCGSRSGYVAVLSADLARLRFGSYFGGSGEDSIRAAAFGGDVVVAVGNTNSDDYPTTPDAWDDSYGGGGSGSSGRDAIVTIAAPEPAEAALLLTGLGTVAALWRARAPTRARSSGSSRP